MLPSEKVFVTPYALERFRMHYPDADPLVYLEFSEEIPISVARFALGRTVVKRERLSTPSRYMLTPDRWGVFIIAEFESRRNTSWPYSAVTYVQFEPALRDFLLQHYPAHDILPENLLRMSWDEPMHPHLGCPKSEIGLHPCLLATFSSTSRARDALFEAELVSVTYEEGVAKFHFYHPAGVYLAAIVRASGVVAGLVDADANEIDDLKTA
jgi:hypothetical protein